jgi:cell division protein FtsI (penicillin-binding protein 3)
MIDKSDQELELAPNHRHTTIELVGVSESAVRISRSRLVIAVTVFTLCFAVLAGRLVYLSVSGDPSNPKVTRAEVTSGVHGERAPIVDRNGILLAGNLVTASLYADARVINNPIAVMRRVADVLPELNVKDAVAKLKSKRAFVWLKRNLTPREQQGVNDLGIPGLAFEYAERRIYPHGGLAAHVLGFTDIDNNGIAGVEQYFDQELKDRARSGKPLALSLDIRVQHALRDELARAMAKFKALGAAGVVVDVQTGEVVAMTSLPDFDPNHPNSMPKDNRFNRATKGVYELGSVFKAFTVAMALDTGTVTVSSEYDARRPIKVSKFTISDFHGKNRWLSVPEILMYSSNIGAAKMAIDVGGVRQQEFMNRLGLLHRSSVELPEVGDPLLPPKWRKSTIMTIAYGHGLSVSPLQMASGLSAVVNGGVLMPATLLKQDIEEGVRGDRVFSRKTSDQMRRLLRLVVTDGGGGRSEVVKGYLIGGKTGSAEKAGIGGYRRKALLTSFVAAFPMNAPRYVVFTLLDEPKALKETHNYATAGWNAAPTAGRIIARIAPLLGVRPQDEDDEEMKNLLKISLNGKRS